MVWYGLVEGWWLTSTLQYTVAARYGHLGSGDFDDTVPKCNLRTFPSVFIMMQERKRIDEQNID